jgi:hypothetical protein
MTNTPGSGWLTLALKAFEAEKNRHSPSQDMTQSLLQAGQIRRF